MELKIVNKEIASNLKELGFYLDTNGNFRNIDNLKEGRVIINPDLQDPKEFYFNNKKAILIPTQSLVVKWLRDVHKIRIFVQYSEANGTYKFEIRIPRIEDWKMERIGFISSFETFEQAEEVGIIEALKLIKN